MILATFRLLQCLETFGWDSLKQGYATVAMEQ